MAHESEDMFTSGEEQTTSASVVAPNKKPYTTITYVEYMDLMEMQRDLPPDVVLQTSDSSDADDESDVATTDVKTRSRASVPPLRTQKQKRLSTTTLNNRSDNHGRTTTDNHHRPGGKENYRVPVQNAKKPNTGKRNSLESGLVPRAITKQQKTTTPVCLTTPPGSASRLKLKGKTPDSSAAGSLPSSSSKNKQGHTDGSISGILHTPARPMSLANSVRPRKKVPSSLGPETSQRRLQHVSDESESSDKEYEFNEEENAQDFSHTLQEVKKTNQLLTKLISHMKKTERRVEAIEDKLEVSVSSSSSSSSTPKTSRKKAVPIEIRRETRRVYYLLKDQVEDFDGWIIAPGVTFKSSENQTVLDRLISEVKGLNPEVAVHHIQDAAYRFYRSCCEQKSLVRRGCGEQRLTIKRRRERLSRKLQERRAALARMSFEDEQQREKWYKAMQIDLMSSEESGCEGEEDVLVVKKIWWRSHVVTQMMDRLDQKLTTQRSSQARRQTKRRVYSDQPSTRGKPLEGDLPKWVFQP